MNSALIVDALLLAAVLEADLGLHRKINWLRILRPLGIAAAIIPLYLKAMASSGAGLTLELAMAAGGVVLGLLATALMRVYRSPQTGRPVSAAGLPYAALWVVVIGARAVFTYGSDHWFSHQVATWQAQHGVSVAAITDALIFEAIAMVLVRTVALAIRARRVARQIPSLQASADGPDSIGLAA